MDILQDLNWRYAVKKFTTEKVSEEKLHTILEAIRLSPSSCGLQPYRIFVIENQQLRAKLGESSFNSQIAESSHLIIFAAYNKVTTQHVTRLIELTAKERDLPLATLDPLFNAIDGYFKTKTDEQNSIWADKQTYLALGTAVTAAASERVDAVPMEGFDPALFDELLDLKAQDLHSAVILSIGYRDTANDYLAGMKKVRIPMQELVSHLA